MCSVLEGTAALTVSAYTLPTPGRHPTCCPVLSAERVGARVTLGAAGTSTKCGSSFVGQSPLKATQLSHSPLQAAAPSEVGAARPERAILRAPVA